MTAIFLKILNMSITAGWIVLAVMVLRLLLKKMPKCFTCALWALVGLRLIFPFSPKSIFSLIPSTETVPEALATGQFSEIHSGITAIDHVVNPAAKISLSYLSAGTSDEAFVQHLLQTAVFIWLTGTCLMLLYLLWSYLRLHRKMSTAILLKDNIWQSEFVDSPFILGLIKPRIYVPFHLNEEVLSHVLAHEKAHIARKDHLVKAFAFLLLSVYWFHPLIWTAYILLCRDIELACDEKVIRRLGDSERKSYLLSLIGYDGKERYRKLPTPACPLAFGEVDLKKRIIRAKTWKKPAFLFTALTLVLCIIAAFCLLTSPKEESLTAPEPFGHPYQVASVVYEAPQYNFSITPETAPIYVLTSDYQLMESVDTLLEQDDADGYWISCGDAKENRLTEKHFQGFIDTSVEIASEGFSLSALLKENRKAWTIDRPRQKYHIIYDILLQKNGDVYLCYGYNYDDPTSNDAGQPASNIRWVLKLSTMKEETLSAKTLFSWRTKYVGDNSAVGNIIYNLTFPQDMTYQQFALQTDAEPYEITITFALSEEDKEQYADHAPYHRKETALLEKNACIMFALIENADIINFKLVNETDEDLRPLTLVYTRQWSSLKTNCDLWAQCETEEQFEAILIKLH